MEQVKPLYYRYWGKTAEGGGYHLLPYHCLDVAAVGEVFLRPNGYVSRRLAQLLGLDEATLIALWPSSSACTTSARSPVTFRRSSGVTRPGALMNRSDVSTDEMASVDDGQHDMTKGCSS